MKPGLSPLERAFELAASGHWANVTAIKKKLRAEGYDISQISGRTLTRQLTNLIRTNTAGSNNT